MFSEKDIKNKMEVRDSHRKWQREYGLVECKRCGGTKVKESERSIFAFESEKKEYCNWCNDDGMVDPWSELMGKKWSEYVHKMY
jgi:hypothetical protein